ncbi:glucose-6-phosphate isomerase [Methyloversatilis universalis]|uniref:glucose-6-phosphate isomerase n=1 Tax=Methyloversatilis universalis TaxID=378211 RepID=UPI00039CF893|nr:glucose-6-phosphate isomerase [Methyloversatilis universalis]
MNLLMQTSAWPALRSKAIQLSRVHLRNFFEQDAERFARFSLRHDGWLLDYSKQRVDGETMTMLMDLVSALDLPRGIRALAAGDQINFTERRAALHMALRAQDGSHADVVRDCRAALEHWVRLIRNRELLGATGQTITHLINLGIGGSDLGPRLAMEALEPQCNGPVVKFVANLDPLALELALRDCKPAHTAFIISSKSFTTQETLANAQVAMKWLADGLGSAGVGQHLFAVTNRPAAAQELGVPAHHCLFLPEWVGGRYSVWSSISLPLACAIGMQAFGEMLDGARSMDEHFTRAPMNANLPVLFGLIDFWNASGMGLETLAVLPYSHLLRSLPSYLQQLEMESNGKRCTSTGELSRAPTSPVVWGGSGVVGQHAYHQQFYQGTRMMPMHFIVPRGGRDERSRMMQLNALAQSSALMRGKTRDEAMEDLKRSGLSEQEATRLAPHVACPGNQPSTTLIMPEITPRSLGQLIALYEHKVFVQGWLLGINSFDQYGVEYGKQMARSLASGRLPSDADASTRGLLSALEHGV